MRNKLYLGTLVAAVCLLSHVCSQATESPDFYRHLTCVTHDLESMTCTWEVPPSAGSNVLYEVCSRSSEQDSCIESNVTNSLQVDFQMFSSIQVRIKAKNVPGQPVISFTKSTEDIPYVPYAPQILTLNSDSSSDTLLVEWTVDSTGFMNGVNIQWEVNVLRGENLQLVKNDTFVVPWNLSQTKYNWNWTSEFPLNCVSHSVRVRCLVRDEFYDGESRHSEWSALKTIEEDPSENMFPVDKVILAGSNISICCRLEKGDVITSIEFNSTNYPFTDLGSGGRIGGIRLTNMSQSEPSGDNVLCHSENDMNGVVVFVGYPPVEPQNFSCAAPDLTIINCTWKAGRPTALYGERGTKYTIYERFSGINLTCSGYTGDQEDFNCSMDVQKGQNLYDFLLLGTNPLGAANVSLDFSLIERITPFPVERIVISDITPTNLSIQWFLVGTYTSVNLLCETEIRKLHGEVEKRNITLKGGDKSTHFFYTYPLINLHPFTNYNFRVRCASNDHFWKWSNWSKEINHKTLAAAPSRKLDTWAELLHVQESCSIAVYWKHLRPYEANGDVNTYSVEWRPFHSNEKPHRVQLSGEFNRTLIHIPAGNNGDFEITVTAINSAGSSPPSTMTTVQLSNDVELERVFGDSSGLNVSWNLDSNFSCGYAVKWVPSFHPQGGDLQWKRFSSHVTSAFIHTQQIHAGVRHNVSVYGCRENKFQLLRSLVAYTEELPPKVAPNFTVQETTSDSIVVKWESVSEDDLRGFLQGFLVYVVKNQSDSNFAKFKDLVHHSETKIKNITSPAVRILKIEDLQSGTNYQLGLQAYTRGGPGPIGSFSVVTNDNAMGLILAILIPIVVAVLLGIVTLAICYHKREWIKETFYPDIPNPENSKALQFEKNVNEGTKTMKTLEMNPCTPNNVEVVESFYTVPKILDTELNSPMSESGQLPEDGSEALDDDHIVISYCQPTSHEGSSNPVLDESATPSQVVYIDVQSIYQPQANSEEDPESDFADSNGYKPQMQLPVSTVTVDNQPPPVDILVESSGYRPQGHPNTWAAESPSSPTSLGSENASFGSPCSVNSRHFLIPPVDNKDSLKPTHIGWSISSIFQNKQDD